MLSVQPAFAPGVSPWPHRLALALVGVTFPLIWIGGLVTTYDAGMAVPDWPTTYGYNLFLYPWQTWLSGPWDLLIEHGHRLWASLAGLFTIALVVVAWRCDNRRWVRWLSLTALAGIIGQGVLGGLRVQMDDVLFARIHGCVGPAFFALAVALAVFTSPLWQSSAPPREIPQGDSLRRLAVATVALAYLQLVLGSALRHMPVTARPADFRTAALFHVLVALALVVEIALLAIRVLRSARNEKPLLRPTAALCLLVVLQIALGLGTWIVKYGWPIWLGGGEHLAGFVVEAEGRLQAHITTAHVAVGSLILATSLVVALRSLRLVRGLSVGPARRTTLEMAI
jgi:cytochrome c oxidase assembly protein subunit 15